MDASIEFVVVSPKSRSIPSTPKNNFVQVNSESILSPMDPIMEQELFLMPWHNKVVVGTTDTPIEKESLEPISQEKELEFILKTASKYLTKAPKKSGLKENVDLKSTFHFYESDEDGEKKLCLENNLIRKISSTLDVIGAQVVWVVRNEMARTVEDFLARRTRCPLLDARESIKMAPKVAEIMAQELEKNSEWKESQVKDYEEVIMNYIL